jgi:hypothetical protein
MKGWSILEPFQKGDTVKITAEGTDRLGLISEVVDDTMIRVGSRWYDFEAYNVQLLHREVA